MQSEITVGGPADIETGDGPLKRVPEEWNGSFIAAYASAGVLDQVGLTVSIIRKNRCIQR